MHRASRRAGRFLFLTVGFLAGLATLFAPRAEAYTPLLEINNVTLAEWGEPQGTNAGVAEPGETITLRVTIRNYDIMSGFARTMAQKKAACLWLAGTFSISLRTLARLSASLPSQ